MSDRKYPGGPLANLKYERFCLEYIKCGKANEAYKLAGFRCKNDATARAAGIRLLSRVNIQARLKELQQKTEAIFIATEIADRTTRVLALRDRWKRLQTVIEERSKSEEMSHAPGGKTGLLCRSMKMIGSGMSATVVEEYELDAALLREMREHEKQAAQELGQWVEKGEVRNIDVVVDPGREAVPDVLLNAMIAHAQLQAGQPKQIEETVQ